MKKILISMVLVASSSISFANSNVYSDDLTRCLVDKTTEIDRLDLMKWIFNTFSSHPALSDSIKNSKLESESYKMITNKKVAKLFERLLTEDCAKEVHNAVKYADGNEAIKSSFQVLGRIAAQELMSNQETNKSMEKFTDFLDINKISNFIDKK